jgi:outer membrane protein
MSICRFFTLIYCLSVSMPLLSQQADTLSLREALSFALQKNFDITLASNQLAIANLSNTPGQAGMLPQIDLTGNQTIQSDDSYQEYYDGRIRDVSGALTQNLQAGIQLNWTFFDGTRMFIKREKLREMEQLGETALQMVTEDLMAAVTIAYYDLSIQQQLAEAFQEALHLSNERVRVAKARYELGNGSELSMLQASVDRNADSSMYLNQLSVIQNARYTLNQLLCRAPQSDLLVSEMVPTSVPLSWDILWEHANRENPLLKAARSQAVLASLSEKEARSASLPSLSLNTGYNFSGTSSDVGIFTVNRRNGYNLGVSLNYPLFDGFNNRQQLRIARIQRSSSEIMVEKEELNLATVMSRVYNQYMTTVQLLTIEEENLTFARHNLTLAMEKYDLGILSDIELRETQLKLLDAETRLLSSLFSCKSSETELIRLSGNLTIQ